MFGLRIMIIFYFSLLLGAEELGLKKSLLPEYGGGLREFSMDELDLFNNASDEASFLTSGERSYIVHHYLIGLRAVQGDTWKEMLTFREGQPMSKLRSVWSSSVFTIIVVQR